MIITISGSPGAGKSTVSQIVAQKLGAVRVYVGGMRRELARRKGMSLEQLNEYAKTHPETDVDIDHSARDYALELEKQGKLVVVEGRPQFHFFPESLKIFMRVDFHEAAKRIWPDLQQKVSKDTRNEGEFACVEELEKSLQVRDAADAARYVKYYGVDHRDLSHYDLVVDTTKMSIEQAVDVVLKFVKKNL